jgi:hypothetical protein
MKQEKMKRYGQLPMDKLDFYGLLTIKAKV